MKAFLDRLVYRFEVIESELNALDAATGDGDHGTTMLRGLRAAAEAEDGATAAFRKAAGGASGTLFSLFFGGLEKAQDQQQPLGEALAQSADRIAQMGQASPGDKTMLDALIPAAEAARTTPETGTSVAAEAAREGAAATRDMHAKRGRARYVEGGGVGHVDAGATSVAEILTQYDRHFGDRA